MAKDLINKNKREIVEEKLSHLISGAPDVANLINGKYDPLIMIKCVEDLEESAKQIKGSVDGFKDSVEIIGEKSDKLSNKLLWLNRILTAATIVGAIATAILAFSG